APRLRVQELRERSEHFGHLVAALAAPDVDNDLRVGPLGQLLLDHRFSGSEGSRDARGSALRNRVERVDDPLARDERDVGREFLSDRARNPDDPSVGQGEGDRARTGLERTDPVADGVFSALEIGEGAAEPGWNEDLVQNELGLLDRAKDGSGVTSLPAFAVAVNSQTTFSSRGGASVPRVMKSPTLF